MNLFANYKDDILTIQRNRYIDDGWVIELKEGIWNIFEIPNGGGEMILIDSTPSFDIALEIAQNLT